MIATSDLAIVLRSVAYEDRHRIVTALTEKHGKITALARNAVQSRRFGGALDLFVAAEWALVERPGADLFRVESAIVKRDFAKILRDFDRLSLGSVMSELILKIAPEREVCLELFQLHVNALALLEELPKIEGLIFAILNGYLAKILQWSGSQPQLMRCFGCQRDLQSLEETAFVTCLVSRAGWICSQCRESSTLHLEEVNAKTGALRVSRRALVDFYNSLREPIRKLPTFWQSPSAEQRGLFEFLEQLLVFHLPGFEVDTRKADGKVHCSSGISNLKSLRFLLNTTQT